MGFSWWQNQNSWTSIVGIVFFPRTLFPRELDLLTNRRQDHSLTQSCSLSCIAWNKSKTRKTWDKSPTGRSRTASVRTDGTECQQGTSLLPEPEAAAMGTHRDSRSCKLKALLPRHRHFVKATQVYKISSCGKSEENPSRTHVNEAAGLYLAFFKAGCSPMVWFFPPHETGPLSPEASFNNHKLRQLVKNSSTSFYYLHQRGVFLQTLP